ncbi:MAG: preprotein translocase subunit YajC [Clostridia bacterium]|nr:preprotein translocase subunit YajC [Clostridia bacterium]
MVAILLVLLVAFMIYSNHAQKKRQKETQETLNALQPGNKVKTIGGICGIVVEVCEEDNTFVLETGTEKSGKSYIKFDKQAVYQTDAVAKKEEPKTEEKVEEKAEEKAE